MMTSLQSEGQLKNSFQSADEFRAFLKKEEVVNPSSSSSVDSRTYTRFAHARAGAEEFLYSRLWGIYSQYIQPYIEERFPLFDLMTTVTIKRGMGAARSVGLLEREKTKILWMSLNVPHSNTWRYLQEPQIPIRIRKFNEDSSLNCSTGTSVTFNHKNGVCRGMCLWLAHCYFETKGTSPNARERLRTFAKYFENGATDGPVILHGFKGLNLEQFTHFLLDLNAEKVSSLESEEWRAPIIEDFSKKKKEYIHLFENLDDGIYLFSLSDVHVIAVIREGVSWYLFEPNEACYEYSQSECSQKLVHLIEKYSMTPQSNFRAFVIHRITPCDAKQQENFTLSLHC